MRHGPTPLVNFHHVMFERSAYQRDPVLRRLREHKGLIIPMFIIEHRALHTTLNRGYRNSRNPTVPLPDREAARHFVDAIALPYSPDQPRVQTLEQAIGFFAMTDNQDTAEQLAQQRDFILMTTPMEIDYARPA